MNENRRLVALIGCTLASLAPAAFAQTISLRPVGGTAGEITVEPGAEVTIEVFVQDLAPAKLRGYQVVMPAAGSGGSAGTLTYSGGLPVVNDQHPEYVFAGLQDFPAVDAGPLPRAASALLDPADSPEVTAARYLVEFVYQVSPDAAGDFTLALIEDQTLLGNEVNDYMTFTAAPATIHVAAGDPPVLVHGAGQTTPRSGYIDPRRESTDGATQDQGIASLTLVFDQPVFGNGGTPAGADDFVVTSTAGAAPTVVDVQSPDNTSFVLTLSGPIPVQGWTTVRAVVQNASGTPISNLGDLGASDEPDRVDLGFLPGDIDQNGVVEPIDLLRFRQYVGIELPGGTCTSCPHNVFGGEPADYFDIDRSGGANPVDPLDLLRYRQLLQGTGTSTRAWAGETLAPRP